MYVLNLNTEIKQESGRSSGQVVNTMESKTLRSSMSYISLATCYDPPWKGSSPAVRQRRHRWRHRQVVLGFHGSQSQRALSFYHTIHKCVVVAHAAGGRQSWSFVFYNSFSVRFLQGMTQWEILVKWASERVSLRVLEAGLFSQCEQECAVFVELVRVLSMAAFGKKKKKNSSYIWLMASSQESSCRCLKCWHLVVSEHQPQDSWAAATAVIPNSLTTVALNISQRKDG